MSGNNALSAESTHNTHTSPASEAHNIMSDKKDPGNLCSGIMNYNIVALAA